MANEKESAAASETSEKIAPPTHPYRSVVDRYFTQGYKVGG